MCKNKEISKDKFPIFFETTIIIKEVKTQDTTSIAHGPTRAGSSTVKGRGGWGRPRPRRVGAEGKRKEKDQEVDTVRL